MEKFKNYYCKIKPYDVGTFGGFEKKENATSSFYEKKPYDLNTNNFQSKNDDCHKIQDSQYPTK
jgi:hypothetical protein